MVQRPSVADRQPPDLWLQGATSATRRSSISYVLLPYEEAFDLQECRSGR
jgi:hypothetical protein